LRFPRPSAPRLPKNIALIVFASEAVRSKTLHPTTKVSKAAVKLCNQCSAARNAITVKLLTGEGVLKLKYRTIKQAKKMPLDHESKIVLITESWFCEELGKYHIGPIILNWWPKMSMMLAGAWKIFSQAGLRVK
jgi:hypothetical protein